MTGLEAVPVPDGECCSLCSLPLRGQKTDDGAFRFCCMGCRQVFLALTAATGVLPEDYRNSELYQACLKAGIIAGGREESGAEDTPPGEPPVLPGLGLSLRLDNMWCPACAWLIEEVLRRKRGISEPRVSFLTDTVRLKYQPHVITPSEVEAVITKTGYRVRPAEGDGLTRKAGDDPLLRLGISAILTMSAMMLSWTVYSGLFHDPGQIVLAALSYPLLFISAPVVFYGGLPILRNAWVGLRIGKTSMDTLITLSALSAFAYSIAQMARGSAHLYFDTAAMLVTIVLFGRYAEAKARRRIFDGIGMEELASLKARLMPDGLERWVRADSLLPGDVFIVRKDERVPVDGRIAGGKALVDQSVLTGEARPISKLPGDDVLAGTLLMEGGVEVSTSRVLSESALSQTRDLVLEALEARGKEEGVTDALSRLFVPVLLAATGCTAVVLLFLRLPGEEVLFRCLTMLLISCPCAIGIAVPLVKVAVVGIARKRGILVRNPEAVKKMGNINTVVLDKTGTLTEGRFALHGVVAEGIDERELFSMLAAVEGVSSHSLAREIVRYSQTLGILAARATDVEELAGIGVSGFVKGRKVFVGNRQLASRCGADLPPSLDDQALAHEKEGMTVVFFGWDRLSRGFLVLGDRIRPEARGFVSWLKERNMRTVLLSGDGEKTTGAVAGSCAVGEYRGEMLPSEKAQAVKDLKAQGAVVMVIGDGVNDMAALAAADVGVALDKGFDPMREAADIVLTAPRLDAVADLFSIAALSARTTHQSLVFAFAYNAVAIPLAAAGFLNPLIAVFAMFASSLTVILNVLRVVRRAEVS